MLDATINLSTSKISTNSNFRFISMSKNAQTIKKFQKPIHTKNVCGDKGTDLTPINQKNPKHFVLGKKTEKYSCVQNTYHAKFFAWIFSFFLCTYLIFDFVSPGVQKLNFALLLVVFATSSSWGYSFHWSCQCCDASGEHGCAESWDCSGTVAIQWSIYT